MENCLIIDKSELCHSRSLPFTFELNQVPHISSKEQFVYETETDGTEIKFDGTFKPTFSGFPIRLNPEDTDPDFQGRHRLTQYADADWNNDGVVTPEDNIEILDGSPSQTSLSIKEIPMTPMKNTEMFRLP